MKLGRSPCRRDLDTSPAWSGKERRVWILIDLDVLDGRRRHARPIRLDSVYNQRHAIRSGSVWVQEARQSGDVVLIKDGKAIQRVAVERVAVLILADFCADLCRRVRSSNGHLLLDASDCQDNLQGCSCCATGNDVYLGF